MAATSALAEYMEGNHEGPKRGASNLSQAKPSKKPRGGPKGATQLKKLLSSLAKEQLVEVLLKLDEEMPSAGIAAKVESILPPPDLEAIQKSVAKTCGKVWSSMPRVRYGSNRDGFSYKRVSGALQAAKRELLEHAKVYAAAKRWDVLLSYLDFAIDECEGLPSGWDNSSHEKPRESAAEQLGKHLEKALAASSLPAEELQKWQAKLRSYRINSAFSGAEAAIDKQLGTTPESS